jgi:uncharacterized protein YukE
MVHYLYICQLNTSNQMEQKVIPTLLLSLAVVAGAMTITTDAYAQTNTERLMNVESNTNSIVDALEALADTIANGFASVMEALGVIEAEVTGVNDGLAAIDSELHTVHDDLSAIDSDLQSVDADLKAIHDDLTNLDADVAALSSGIGGASAALGALESSVSANSANINALSEKLDMISEAVGAVQTTVETQEDVDPAVTNMLHTAETVVDVAVADFANTVTKAPSNGVYKASNTFSCTGDVFVDDMSIEVSDNGAILSSVADAPTPTAASLPPMSLITVEGSTLFSVFDNSGPAAISADNVHPIVAERNFDNRFLRAGDGLTVRGVTDQSDGELDGLSADNADNRNYLAYEIPAREGSTAAEADRTVYFTLDDYVGLKNNKALLNATLTRVSSGADAYNASKATLSGVDLYTITINWFAASSDTTCSITSAVETTSGLPNADRTVLVALNLDTNADVGPPTPFIPANLDCNGEDTEITGISIQAGGIAGLNQFIEVELSAGGEPGSVSFENNNKADSDASDLPFRFSGSDLTVSGEGIGTLLLQVTYDTTQGNTCK